MQATFKGGLRIDGHKNTRRSQIRRMPAPAEVFVPLSRYGEVSCESCVAAGDRVLRGQIIGMPEGGLGVPVHSPVSGVVKEIGVCRDASGCEIPTVRIENDGENTLASTVKPYQGSLAEAKSEEIVEIILSAGICGMGGDGYPTYAKLSDAIGKAEVLIINCAESEPYATSIHRLLLENPASVINGTKILLKALGISRAIIGIESNKLDAANKVEELLVEEDMISVKVLKCRYPQGDERQMVYALTGKRYPVGKGPEDVGAAIFSGDTVAAIYQAFAHGMPLMERTVTVDGDCINNPKNVMVPIGTPLSALIEFCGGLKKKPEKLLVGGAMKGEAVSDRDVPITKTTTAVLALSRRVNSAARDDYACIRCGRCVDVCPMGLMPLYLAQYGEKGKTDKCEKYNIDSCTLCGACSYACPGGVPIAQIIRSVREADHE